MSDETKPEATAEPAPQQAGPHGGELSDEALNAVTGAATYTINFTNQSPDPNRVVIFQKPLPPPNNTPPLFWVTFNPFR